MASSDVAAAQEESRQFPCEQCGAFFELAIGQAELECPYCGFKKAIDIDPGATAVEHDLEKTLTQLASKRAEKANDKLGATEASCKACGAVMVFDGPLMSTHCDYCGAPIQRADAHAAPARIPVDAVVPFAVSREDAHSRLRAWVKSRWFAPGDFKKRGIQGRFSGVYLPFFTFDAMTKSFFEGERGDHYYVEVGSGQQRRREMRTRWTRVSGSFSRFFDDVIVCAMKSAAQKLIAALKPWPLGSAKPFAPELLAGFRSMTYDIELGESFAMARARMNDALHAETSRRIGGDVQRISRLDTNWAALTYKHVLLPVWMLAYRYRGKSYQVVVNAGTGEVNGQRPWSALKIALAVLMGLGVALGVAYFGSQGGEG
jgi:DNA-directed RNA polymerase subunit RPC12/RpoP